MLKFDTNDYGKEIEIFLDYMRGKLHRAWNEEANGNNEPIEKLYDSTFKITWEGATLELCFGASEFQGLEDFLENILDEVGED